MAPAASADTRSSFIAKLLAPIATPPNTVAGRRLLREMQEDAKRVWSIALHRFYAADAYRSYVSHAASAAEIERRTLSTIEGDARRPAELAMLEAVNRLMMIPAPTIGALRQKEKLRAFNGGRDRWEAAIAADHKRLSEKR